MTATTGKEWRKPREEGIELAFPSGNIARIRPLQLDVFLRATKGIIPDFLTPLVQKELEGTPQDFAEVSMTLEDTMQTFDMLDAITRACFIYPRIVETPQSDDEITVEDVEFQDKQYLFGFMGVGAADLRRFRRQQIRNMASVPANENGGAETVGDTGDTGNGQPTDGVPAAESVLDESPV